MVNRGLDPEFHAVLEAVHWLVDGCDEERDGEDVVPALNFLVGKAGMPPDAQVRPGTRPLLMQLSGVLSQVSLQYVPVVSRNVCCYNNRKRPLIASPRTQRER